MKNLKVDYKRAEFTGYYYENDGNRQEYTEKGYQVYVNGKKYAIILKDDILNEWACYPDLKSDLICGGLTLKELKDTLENTVLPKDRKFAPAPKKPRKDRFVFSDGENIQVIRIGKTANKKIAAAGEKIVQTYTFSVDQYDYIADHITNGTKPEFKTFFSLDFKNCGDCLLSGNMRAKDGNLTTVCYTNKMMQYSGFISMLKSIFNEFGQYQNIPVLSADLESRILDKTKNLFVRFGSYGEPSKHPLHLVKAIAESSKSFTGYTHQYHRINRGYAAYFMASTHNERQAATAKNIFGFRSFISSKENSKINAVICPASAEGGDRSNCSKCGLCSGTFGKGQKNIKILTH